MTVGAFREQCLGQLCLTSRIADVGAYTYGLGHPMKPQRMRITHELVSVYGMLDKMHVLVSPSLHVPGKQQSNLTRLESETCDGGGTDAIPYR